MEVGQERPDDPKGRLANQVVGVSLLAVGVVGAAIALLLGRPDVAIDGIVPIVLGLGLLIVGRLMIRHWRS